MTIRSWAANLALSAASILITLLLLEMVLRFLPVNTGLRIQAVNQASPYFHGEPNRDFVFSRDWNFSLVNRGRLNAHGYVNDHDYDHVAALPLLAVVGDSMIEALMVPFDDTVHGRLARELQGRVRVYSFAFSGAPLSQYLAWAKHAVESYDAKALAIFVMSNDFDESIARFADKPGFYQYVRFEHGDDWVWVRNDYTPSGWFNIVNASSLLQYLYRNVRITAIAGGLRKAVAAAFARDSSKRAPGAKAADAAGQQRLAESRQIVDRFLRDIVLTANLPPDRVLFVIDGQRGRIYRGLPRDDSKDYGAKMLSYFTAAAHTQGFEVLDLHEVFQAEFALNHRSFQFPTDGHWNGYAHGIVERALLNSKLLQSLVAPNLEEARSRQ